MMSKVIVKDTDAMSKQEESSRDPFLRCADWRVSAQIGFDSLLFEWLHFNTMKVQECIFEVEEVAGRRWVSFSYRECHEKFKAYSSPKQVEKAISRLEGYALVESRTDGLNSRKKWYAINLATIETMFGREVLARYRKGVADFTPNGETSQAESVAEELPEQGDISPNGETLAGEELPNQGDTSPQTGKTFSPNGETSLYIQIDLDKKIDSQEVSSDEEGQRPSKGEPDDASEDEPLEESVEEVVVSHRFIWRSWRDLVYAPDRQLSNNERDMVGRAVKQATQRYGEPALFKLLNSGRFHAFLILRDDWFVQGKITSPMQLLKSLDFMKNHEAKKGPEWFAAFESKFPDWRVQSQDDCTKFAKDARAAMPEVATPVAPTKRKRGLADWQRRPTQAEEPQLTAEELEKASATQEALRRRQRDFETN